MLKASGLKRFIKLMTAQDLGLGFMLMVKVIGKTFLMLRFQEERELKEKDIINK